MASFKLNIARIRGCPEPADLLARMEEFGLPDNDEFGVLNCSASSAAVSGAIVRKTQQALAKLDNQTKELTSTPVERVTVYPFAVWPQKETLEIYAGSASGIEQLGAFFSSCLALPVVVEGLEIDLPDALDKLAKETQRFQLRSIRVSDYAHNSFMIGPYAPKFLDSQHGLDFLGQYLEAVTTASVRFQGANGRVNVSLTPKACFSFSCHEDDQQQTMATLRKLL